MATAEELGLGDRRQLPRERARPRGAPPLGERRDPAMDAPHREDEGDGRGHDERRRDAEEPEAEREGGEPDRHEHALLEEPHLELVLEPLHRREDGHRVLEKRLERDGEPEQPHGEDGVPRAVHEERHGEVDRPGQAQQHELQRRGRPPALGDRARVPRHRARQDDRDAEVEHDPEDAWRARTRR